jgi:hypothetical protein
VGKTSTQRCNDLHGGQDIGEGKKQAMQPAARQFRRQEGNETSDAATGVARKTAMSEGNV